MAVKGSFAWIVRQHLRNVYYRVSSTALRVQGAVVPDITFNDERLTPNAVVCLPIIEWSFRFQRPQQLMLQFARHGWRVQYASLVATRVTEKAPNVFEVPVRELTRAELVVVQHPKWAKVARQLGGRVIYDCMDDISAFSTEGRSDHERALMADADLVVVTSAALEREARKHAKQVIVVRNGCDYEHFARAEKASGARKVIGYYGAISDWFDVALVADLARRRPDWDFVLIGATYGANLLPFGRLANVTLPGEQPYTTLPEWLGKMDVCIIPFKRNALTEATNPVKVYEMLAAGKPVVSVPIPEVAALAPLVRLAWTAEEFEREIVAAFDDVDEETRRAFARGQTWEKRYEELIASYA